MTIESTTVKLAPGTVAAALLLAGTAAHAQLLPPDQSLVHFDRYTSVRERMIPGFTANDIHLGGFTLSPQISAIGQYSDNIFALERGTANDTSVEIAPSATLTTDVPNRSLSITAGARIDRFAHYHSENDEEADASVYGTQDLGRSTRLRAIGRFHTGRESRESQNATSLTQRPVRYDTQGAGLGVSQQFASVLITGEGDFQRSKFYNATLRDGTPLDQQYRNNDFKTLRVRGELAQSPSLAYFAQATRGWVDYTGKGNAGGAVASLPGADPASRSLELLGGVRFELPVRARGEIGVGYVDANFRGGSVVRHFAGVAVNTNVTLFPTQLITVTLNGQRSLNDAGTTIPSGYVALSGGANVDYELRRYLILGANVQLERDTFNALNRRDGRVTLGASAEYRLTGGFWVRGSYDRLDLSSVGTDRYKSLVRNRLQLGLTFRA